MSLYVEELNGDVNSTVSAVRRFESWGVSWEDIQFVQFGRGEGERGGGRFVCCQDRIAYI